MAIPVLPNPPLTTPLVQGALAAPVWARWLQQLRDAAAGKAAWIFIGAAGAPAFSSGNFTAVAGFEPAFRLVADTVQFNAGVIAIGAAVPTNNQVLFTLPLDYRPRRSVMLPSVTRDGSSNDVFASIAVDSAGNVRLRYAATWFANSFIALPGSFSTSG